MRIAHTAQATSRLLGYSASSLAPPSISVTYSRPLLSFPMPADPACTARSTSTHTCSVLYCPLWWLAITKPEYSVRPSFEQLVRPHCTCVCCTQARRHTTHAATPL